MSASPSLVAALAGLTFGLSLIVAIGAQNAFVLRQGLRRKHRGIVVVTCALSDVVLIVAGVAGAGAVLSGRPSLTTAVRVAGAAFLIVYGLLAARRALRPTPLLNEEAAAEVAPRSWVAVLATTLAFTWLNPHVYLDTLLLVGSAADSHGDARWWFGGGTALGSVLWFTALGYGSTFLRPWFERPTAWRILDGLIATVMLALGISLAISA